MVCLYRYLSNLSIPTLSTLVALGQTDRVEHRLARPPPLHVDVQQLHAPLGIVLGRARDVRRDEAVLGRPQRVPVRQRLRVRDVQTRRADAAFVQRLHQRGVVDQAAPRDVDDDRRRF